MLCVSCASTIPEGARFCPTCGHAVAAGQTEERRIVTVLFADIVGFTGLAEYTDPEQVKRMVDSWFEALVADVTAFGGRVDKFLGDGILALFGAPVAHEDDAERAVRTALRMHDTLAAAVASSRLAITDIRLRVGINTGEVLVGTLAGTDYTAMGDVVNLASRLQTSAPPGGVYVGAATYELTRHAIAYDEAGEIDVRGREQSITAWLATGATAPPGARRHRRDVALIGRDIEMNLAAAALDTALVDGSGVLLDVSGENGLGKSRLIDELIDRLGRRGVAILRGSCVPYGEANVWWPIASALSAYLDLEPGQSADTVIELAAARARKLSEHLADTDVDRLTSVFTHLLGYPSAIDRLDPSAARTAIHSAVTSVLSIRSSQKPMVLCIDDLHWADPLLIDLLDHLVRALSRQPFALITAMRPGSDVEWPPRTERTTVVSLRLQPLGRDSTERLVRELLPAAPERGQADALYERSGGNPLFLIELAALAQRGTAADLPDSLRTLIAARLDQLTVEQRQVLDNAAVLGTSGATISLERFAAATNQHFTPALLQQLDDLGLIEVRGRRWQFRSDSMREVAYQTITKTARAQRHAGIAMSMATNESASIDELAHHFASAAELLVELGQVEHVPSAIISEAVDRLMLAARRAREAGSLRVTLRHATRALDLLASGRRPSTSEDVDPRTLPLLIMRAATYIDQRNHAPAHVDLDAALDLATAHTDSVSEGQIRRLRGSLAQIEGRLDVARAELDHSIQLLRHSENLPLLAEAVRARGFIELFGGSLAAAEASFDEAASLYHVLDDQRGLAWIDQHRAWAAFLSNDTTAARARLESAAATMEAVGDRNGIGWAFGLLAFVEFFEHRFDEAERLARIVAEEADERGDDWASAMMQTLLADLSLWRGKLDESIALAESARTKFRKLGDKFGIVQSSAPIVRAQIGLGRSAAAQRGIEELIALGDTSPQGPYPLMAASGAAMHRGDGRLATQLARRAIDEMVVMRGASFEPFVIESLGWLQQDEAERALTVLDEAGASALVHPFTRSAAALAHSIAGDPIIALDHAAFVAEAPGATYLDQVIAYVAAGNANARLGDPDQARLTIEAAVAGALAVGDVVALGLATGAYGAITGSGHPAHDPGSPLSAGWATVIGQLTTAGQPTHEGDRS